MWFPNWGVQRLRGERPELEGGPLILHAERSAGGSVVIACSEEAAELGVAPGMSLAEATAISGVAGGSGTDSRSQRQSRGQTPASLRRPAGPLLFPHNPLDDRRALEKLGLVCHRWTPRVALEQVENPESLLLDIAGCEHLFGGEKELIEAVRAEFRSRGYRVRLAAAHTLGAAWGLARHGERRASGPAQAHSSASSLRALPVAALRLPADTLRKLRRLGLETIGQVKDLPRAALPSRFGKLLLERLDQLTGARGEPVPLLAPPAPLEAGWDFDDPVNDRRLLEEVLRRLLDQLARRLAAGRRTTMRVKCLFESGGPAPCSPSSVLDLFLTRPTASASHLQELASLKLERAAVPTDVSRVRVEAEPLPSPAARQRSLFDEEAEARSVVQLASLLDRLRSRLGDRSVLNPDLVDDWAPERSVRWNEMKEFQIPSPDVPPAPPAEAGFWAPVRVYRVPLPAEVVLLRQRPLRLRWERREEFVTESLGPHRVETGWWRRRFLQRDYYRIATCSGRRLWIFERPRKSGWFLAGE